MFRRELNDIAEIRQSQYRTNHHYESWAESVPHWMFPFTWWFYNFNPYDSIDWLEIIKSLKGSNSRDKDHTTMDVTTNQKSKYQIGNCLNSDSFSMKNETSKYYIFITTFCLWITVNHKWNRNGRLQEWDTWLTSFILSWLDALIWGLIECVTQ